MPVIIYCCDKCLFTFERAGSVDSCPDCGYREVRPANEDEQAQYFRIKAELKECGSGFA